MIKRIKTRLCSFVESEQQEQLCPLSATLKQIGDLKRFSLEKKPLSKIWMFLHFCELLLVSHSITCLHFNFGMTSLNFEHSRTARSRVELNFPRFQVRSSVRSRVSYNTYVLHTMYYIRMLLHCGCEFITRESHCALYLLGHTCITNR